MALNLKTRLVLFDRFIELALPHICIAKKCMSVRGVPIQFESFLQLVDCLVVLTSKVVSETNIRQVVNPKRI